MVTFKKVMRSTTEKDSKHWQNLPSPPKEGASETSPLPSIFCYFIQKWLEHGF
jgi:hypothetical protein